MLQRKRDSVPIQLLASRYLTLLCIATVVLLAACADNTVEAFSYGPAKVCYDKNQLSACDKYIANDRLVLSANQTTQEVTYQLIGMRLDHSNTIFKTLKDCKVVNSKNFTCEGFTVSEGKVIEATLFQHKLISQSAALFWASNTLKISFDKDLIKSVDRYANWITGAAFITVVLVILWMAG